MYGRHSNNLYFGHGLLTWGILLLVLIIAIGFFASWSASGKVAGDYRFIKQESRQSPTDAEKRYIENNLRKGTYPGGKMKISLGTMSSKLELYRPNGTLFKTFTGDRPVWYHADIQDENPDGMSVVRLLFVQHLGPIFPLDHYMPSSPPSSQ